MEYAGKAEAVGVVQVALLDELERITASLFPLESFAFQDEWLTPSLHLDSSSPPAMREHQRTLSDVLAIDFLHLAVRCGLSEYVNQRLTKSLFDAEYINSLLVTALTKYHIEYPRRDGSVFRRDEASFETIRALVDHSNLPDISKAEILQQRTTTALEMWSCDSFIHRLDAILRDFFRVEGERKFPHMVDPRQQPSPASFVLETIGEYVDEIDTEFADSFPDEDHFEGQRDHVRNSAFVYR